MMNQGLTSHEEVISQVAGAAWGAYFSPSSRLAPAVSETIRIIARGPSDVLTAKTPIARSVLASSPAYCIGFQPCGFLDGVRIMCYLATWTLATRSRALIMNKDHPLSAEKGYHRGFIDPQILSDLSGVAVGTVKYALAAFCDDGAVQMIREDGVEKFRCDVGFFIT